METPATRVQLIQAESKRLGQYLYSLPPRRYDLPCVQIRK
jgi:hypothetical protein